MFPRFPFILFILIASSLFPPTSAWTAGNVPAAETPVLARVDVTDHIEDLGIPIHADLVDSTGHEYLLTIASPSSLSQLKEHVTILDTDAEGKRYLIALERRSGARNEAALKLKVLQDDGRQIIIRETPSVYPVLEALGFGLTILGDRPLRLPERNKGTGQFLRAPLPLASDPVISGIIEAVSGDRLTSYVSALSGVTPVTVDGSPYYIATRNSSSGVPILKATQYVYEHLTSLGLTTTYHQWTDCGLSNRNVVAELPGVVHPEQVVLITAHMDDMPDGTVAPGADDNASGTAAVMVAADILKGYRFDRTIRFVLFTGEEQGFCGSMPYAKSVSEQNIAAVLNMDMIAFNTAGSTPTLLLHTRPPENPGYASDLAIANTFIDTATTYSLPLAPAVKADGEMASDHYSFWVQGFPAILAIEDDYTDFMPYYHTVYDTLNAFNVPYFTAYVKAALGTVARLAVVNSQLSYQIGFQKTGTGSGTITPSSGAITWTGNNGFASYPSNSRIDLTALATADSSFVGWEGACSGNANPCPLLVSSDLSVTARFSLKTDFTASPTTGTYPLRVSFADLSVGNPFAWEWSFGDGEKAFLKDPAHIYRTSGKFTVSLSATGDGGAATTTRDQYIDVAPCGNQPARIAESGVYYPSIQSGYNALSEDEHLRIQALGFIENLSLANPHAVSLQGGYDCGFFSIVDYTLIHGTVTVGGGPLTIDGGIIIAQ